MSVSRNWLGQKRDKCGASEVLWRAVLAGSGWQTYNGELHWCGESSKCPRSICVHQEFR